MESGKYLLGQLMMTRFGLSASEKGRSWSHSHQCQDQHHYSLALLWLL